MPSRSASTLSGFPAHAGMDPHRATTQRGHQRFPRTRGDGPYYLSGENAPTEVSPHTRGWTHIEHIALMLDRGFPAHAGMDPRLGPVGRRRDGFPRTRGDGPFRQNLR